MSHVVVEPVWTILCPLFPGVLIGQSVFPLQSAVEFVSAMGLQLETIVSRLSLKLGGRLAHCEDSYREIGAQESCIDIIRNGYMPTWIKKAPWQKIAPCNPIISDKASNVLDIEVDGLLEKGAIREVSQV